MDRETPFIPVFPVVFQDDDLTYGRAYDVFTTHYLQRGKYGDGALMKLEHFGLYQQLLFQSNMGEKFYLSDLAANFDLTKPTAVAYLDRLENLKLIRRVRNACSFDRWISIVMHTPFAPGKMTKEGPLLMDRIVQRFVQEQRKEAGPSRWPHLQWDAETMMRALRGQAVAQDLHQMQDAVGTIMARFRDAGYNDFAAPAFEQQVKDLCHSWDAKFTDKLFLTAMCERALRRAPEKEAAL